MIFDELHTKINSVINRFDEIMVEVMVSRKEEIIDLNVSQILSGYSSDGMLAEPGYRSSHYATFKQSIGSKAPLGVPDLKLTGDFIEGVFTEKRSDGLFIDSQDEKSEMLQKKYTPIFGIMPENTGELSDILINDIQKKIIDEITG